MDFIKTSSLRALIELTFQRNWNGLIWMSRKGVIAKRVKTAPDGSIENQRPNAQSGWPRNECSALGQNIRPSEVSAKVNHRPITITTRETLSRGRPATTAHATRARPPREPGNKPRGRATHSRTTTVPSEPGTTPASGRETIGHSNPSDHTADRNIRPRPFRLAKTRLSGRSSRPTVRTPRSTRSRF
ncbi:unnamed protein product [Microthlaspi erraticum]|uniref:Uncharacterized protein n=1 Tax=Microthlaspi erraticum TaxID=1685480 RepID=A0A6D2KB65_9BRAS|nr:unnamed protein product [Microthlaspi erraticum]